MCHSSCGPSMQAMWKHQESKNLEALWENYHLLVLLFRKRIYIYIDEMVNKCQQQVRPVQLHFRTLTWFVTKSESQPFIWRPFFVQRHSTAQSNCCTTWKSGQGSSGSRGNSARAAAPPALLFVWPIRSRWQGSTPTTPIHNFLVLLQTGNAGVEIMVENVEIQQSTLARKISQKWYGFGS